MLVLGHLHRSFLVQQVTALGNCDMMKEVSAHFSSISRTTGHHVQDLPSHLATVLSPCHLQLALSMLRRMETVAEAAASQVLLPCIYGCENVSFQSCESGI